MPEITRPEASPRARVAVMGIPFDPITESEAIERILSSAAAKRGGTVVTPNLDIVRQVGLDPDLLTLVEGSDLSLVDGTTLLWASRLQGTPLPERVTGSSLIFSLTQAASKTEVTIFLLGGSPHTAETAAAHLKEKYPGIHIAGTHCPPMSDFAEGSKELEEIRRVMREARPGIVFVGLGFPKQERLIAKLRHDLPETWFLGVGMALGFASGEVSRAPHWVQAMGLEWFHRMLQEPRRLFWRFMILDLPYSARLFADALRVRLSHLAASPAQKA